MMINVTFYESSKEAIKNFFRDDETCKRDIAVLPKGYYFLANNKLREASIEYLAEKYDLYYNIYEEYIINSSYICYVLR